MLISGKVALVTGGAGGIGFAIVKELLNNGIKGVAIVDISETDGLKAVEEISKLCESDRVIFVKADITKEQELRDAYEKTVDVFKQLDFVFNNAGVCNEFNFELTVQVNLIATIRSTYLALEKYFPKYKSGEEGVIINTSSIAGLGSYAFIPTYCATKHGIIAFGQAVGTDVFYNKYKARVVTMCPTATFTNMIQFENVLFKEIIPDILKQIGEVDSPEHLARNFLKVLEEGKNGSTWVSVADTEAYEYEVANKNTWP